MHHHPQMHPAPRMRLPRRYLESQTTCSRKARLGSCIAIGAGTTIGDDCVISRCVIGRGCTIGKGVNLHGCYLQVCVGVGGVFVGDGRCRSSGLLLPVVLLSLHACEGRG